MKRFCMALDLKNDPKLIAEYEEYHKNVWPEIIDSLHNSGIQHMEIYRVENRLFLIADTDDDFSLERKSKMDQKNPRVQEWEKLMWKYQQALPTTPQGEKWLLARKVFETGN